MPILTVDDSVDDSVDCSAHSCPGISIPPVSMVPTESGRGGSTTIQSMEYSQTIMVEVWHQVTNSSQWDIVCRGDTHLVDCSQCLHIHESN